MQTRPTLESTTAFSGSSFSSEESKLLRLLEDFCCKSEEQHLEARKWTVKQLLWTPSGEY